MEHHTKINLNTKDLKHLQVQFLQRSKEKLDLYLPTDDASDPLKARVQTLIYDFIYDILENAKYSLDIDGINPKEKLRYQLENPTRETEPFDFSLQEQVRKLYQQVEDETIKVTKLRRETPLRLKRTYEQSCEESFNKLQQLQKEVEDSVENDKSIDEREETFIREVKPKLDNVSQEYKTSLEVIKDLKDRIYKERGDIEKIDQVGRFLINQK